MKLESALKRTEATKYNIQNGISYLQVQDGALKVAGSILDRMSELKSFYNDVSKNDLDRENYNYEFNELQAQLNEVKAAKFNGVSLFATVEPDNNPMKIITTEDGVTGQVEMNRTGLFENLKSKFGADSVLNTGSNGTYRQFVGDYTVDGVNAIGGATGVITQDYKAGDIVYFNGGGVAANAGYFQVMADGANITDVTDSQGNVTKTLVFDPAATINITDSGTTGTNFIKIGNALPTDAANHDAFAEAYQNAEEYSALNRQYNGTTEIGYLKGTMIKVKISNDTDGPGYQYYKAAQDTTPGDFATSFAAGEWTELGQLTAGVASAAGNRIVEPSRANGTLDVDNADGDNNTATGIDGMTYQRGDKLYYQGDYYMYVSVANSASAALDAYNGAAQDGYTYMEDLIDAGAVVKLNGYVDDKPRGGSPDADPNAFYDANTELKYIDRLPNSGMVRTNTTVRAKDPSSADGIYRTNDDQFYKGLNAGNDGIYGTSDDYYQTTSNKETARGGYHIDADFDNNKDLLDDSYDLSNFSVADFVDYIQTLANARAINGGTMSRLSYAEEMLDENRMNLEAATSRIVDADMALESTKFARQNVLVQAGAAMVVQANQLSNIVLALLA
jgi:flagellin-like hook-associated protein FlgL